MASPREGAMAGRNAGCSTPQIHGIDATVVPLWCPSCLLALGNLQRENDAFFCMPQFAFFGTGHCYGATLVAIGLPSLDKLTMVSEPLKMQQFKAKILRIGKIRKNSTAATLPFTPMKEDCVLLWGSRFSLPKAHHFKYPPSEAVWTISLKVRSLAKFWLKSSLPQGLQTSDLTEELAARVLFLLSSSKPHRGRILSMDLAVKLKLRNT